MRLLLGFILFGLLLSGCVSINGNNQSGMVQNLSQNSTQNLTPVPPNVSGGITGQNKYNGLNFSQLIALNLPVVCDITYIHLGQTFDSKVYVKGSSNIRVESVGGSGLSQCIKTISIVQGNQVFVSCENKTVMPSCDWVVSRYDPETMGQTATFDFSSTPADQIACVDWEFDPSMFATPGNACQLGN